MSRRRRARVGRTVEGRVLPIELGQDGVRVRAGGCDEPLTIAAGVPGDKVRLRGGELERVISPAPARVPAPCPLLQSCGGCSLQAMDYRAQLEAKTEALRAALTRVAGVDPRQVRPVVGLGRPFGFRTKLLMVADPRVKDGLRLGFYRRGTTQQVVPAEGCPVQHPQALAALATVRQLLDARGVRSSGGLRGGWLHGVGLRVDPTSDRTELTLAARTPRLPGELVEPLARVPTVRSVHLCAAPQRSSYLMEGPLKRLAGSRRIPFCVGGERFALSVGTFFQVSAGGAELLLEQVLAMLPEQIETLADLYAGAGIFSLLTAHRWRRALAVEASPSAVGDLLYRLEREPRRGLTVIHERVERCIEAVLARSPAVVLLDPPRTGCKPEVIEALVQRPPPTILYVSCGFSALERELARLVAGGYAVVETRAVDLFPHTAHLEVLVRLER